MKTKRLICAVLVILTLISSGSALAAGAGEAEDPLVSLSYANGTFSQFAVAKAQESISKAIGQVTEKAIEVLGGNTRSFKMQSMKVGDTISLTLGGSVTLVSGSAQISVSSGEVINISTGKVVSSGQSLTLGSRYLAAENSAAVVTFLSNGSAALDGGAKLGTSGQFVRYSDVPQDYWAYDYIGRLSSLSIVQGTGDGKFDPLANVTRGDFVTILGRLEGVDQTKYTGSSFSDVGDSVYYAPYIKWASANNIVLGYSDGKFQPSAKISRQDMALIIVRYADFAKIDLPSNGSATDFSDDSKIASYANQAVYMSRDAGLVQGKPGNLFDPLGNAARAEICAIIVRLIDLG